MEHEVLTMILFTEEQLKVVLEVLTTQKKVQTTLSKTLPVVTDRKWHADRAKILGSSIKKLKEG